jgi:hypothetical protein
MTGAEVIRRARRRAGISQAELARRLGTGQPVVARWETGTRAPTLESVGRAVRACGLRLDLCVERVDDGEDALLHEWMKLSPEQRLRRNEEMLATEEWAGRARPSRRQG